MYLYSFCIYAIFIFISIYIYFIKYLIFILYINKYIYYIYTYTFYFLYKISFIFIFVNFSKHIKFIFKTFCEYVFKIFIKRIDHFAACNLFSSWICVQDEDLHCCSCIYLSANSLSNGNVQRCSRCKARRYLVMALCTAVIGLAD